MYAPVRRSLIILLFAGALIATACQDDPATYTGPAAQVTAPPLALDPGQTVSGPQPTSLPGQPLKVQAVPAEGAALVTWIPPTDLGGGSVVAYTILAHPGPASSTSPANSITSSVFGLDPSKSYNFTVLAINSLGFSVPSSPSNSVRPRGTVVIEPNPTPVPSPTPTPTPTAAPTPTPTDIPTPLPTDTPTPTPTSSLTPTPTPSSTPTPLPTDTPTPQPTPAPTPTGGPFLDVNPPTFSAGDTLIIDGCCLDPNVGLYFGIQQVGGAAQKLVIGSTVYIRANGSYSAHPQVPLNMPAGNGFILVCNQTAKGELKNCQQSPITVQ